MVLALTHLEPNGCTTWCSAKCLPKKKLSLRGVFIISLRCSDDSTLMEQEKLLSSIARTLARLKIPYLITGGIAVVVWGRPRFTADIDIVVELLPQKLSQLARALRKIDKDVYVDERAMRRALAAEGEFNFIHPASGLKVDFWILTQSAFDKERMKRRVRRRFAGSNIYISSPEDLILIKLLWYKETNSTRQLEDIESIVRIQKKLNWRYIKGWTERQGTQRIVRDLRRMMKA